MRYTNSRYGAIPRKDWGGALTGASSGFKMGASIGGMFGPIGAGIAGGVGALTGALFGNASENKRDRLQRQQDEEIARAKAAEKVRTATLEKKQLFENDNAELGNFRMNNSRSLFMPNGGKVTSKAESLYMPLKKKAEDTYWNSNTRDDSTEQKKAINYNLKRIGNLTVNADSVYNYNTGKKMKRNLPPMDSTLQEMQNKISNIPIDDAKKLLNVNWFEKGIGIKDIPTIYKAAKSAGVGLNDVNRYYKHIKGLMDQGYTYANGGAISANGVKLSGKSKLLTNSRGGTTGSHEQGDNIPIKRNAKVVAIAEPGEVIVNDKDITPTPFVLSKRLGFADRFLALEDKKTSANEDIIEDEQSKLVKMNNRLVSKSKNKLAFDGISLFQNASNTIGKNVLSGRPAKNSIFNKIGDKFKDLDVGTIGSVTGTVGNLIMSNKTIKRQKGLIQNSLNEALAYEPKLNKNYLLNENVDVNDSISAVNQGYNSAVSNLQGIDSAVASAVKTSANSSRIGQLGSVYGNRNNMRTSIRNQNTMGIAQNNASNNNLLNQTSLMKLNAKIAANEQLGDAESARLGNVQGAMSEFNTIMRDKEMMESLKARWKDSIGDDFIRTSKDSEFARGGKLRKRRRTMAY